MKRLRKNFWGLGALTALLLAAGGCSCDDGGTGGTKAEILLPGAVDDPTDVADYLLDFQNQPLNRAAPGYIEIRNIGSAPLKVAKPEMSEPFGSDITAAGLLVPVDGSQRITFTFTPMEEGVRETVVTLQTDGDKKQITVRLVGNGVAPTFSCTPDELNFGNVVHLQTLTREFECTNSTELELTLVLDDEIGGDDSSFFSLPPERRIRIPSGASQKIPVTFDAKALGERFAYFAVQTETERRNLQLTATVIESAIEVEPEGCLDFGYVAPGARKELPMTIRNNGSEPLTVTGLATTAATDRAFSLNARAPLEIVADNPDTAAKENEQEVMVTFAPSQDDEGRMAGTIQIDSTDPGINGSVQRCVTGYAGGPIIQCNPQTMDFGQVAVGIPVSRTVTCVNVGSDDPNSTTDNLYVTDVADAGEFGAQIRNVDGSIGPKPAGYAQGEVFLVDITYGPTDEGVDDEAVLVHSNDAANSEYPINVTGNGRVLPPCEFEIRPPSLTFGIVNKGSTVEGAFVIKNLFDSECLVNDLRLSDDSSDAFSLSDGPLSFASIPANGELQVKVQFHPERFATDPYTATVQFNISDPANPVQEVPVSGVSQEPCALIAPDHLNFGTVAPNCSTRERFLTIVNVCSTPITVTGIDIPATGGATDEFKIRRRPAGIDQGVSISPGSQIEFTMAYVPEDEGTDLGMVFIQTAEIPEAPYMATLEGRGAADAIQTDKFSQDEAPKVDLLFVIDNSGSMGWAQELVADNLDAFLSFARNQQIDFQLGVTTTGLTPSSGCPGGVNGGEDGRLFPVVGTSPRILTPATPDLEDHWRNNVDVGICHGSELGIEAAYRALSPPLIDSADDPRHGEPNDGNLGFLRRDAHLSILFLSDEEDQSPQSTTFYYNFFMSLKGFRNSNLFSAHAIVGDKNRGCTNAQAGDRYIALAEASNGIWQSICAADWSVSLEKIGTAAFGFKTRFFLTNQPEDTNLDGKICDVDCHTESPGPDGEIMVRLDGVQTPSVKGNGARVWEYDASVNAVDFYPLFVPEPGTAIEVSYKVACLLP